MILSESTDSLKELTNREVQELLQVGNRSEYLSPVEGLIAP